MRILVALLAALGYASANHEETGDCVFRRRGIAEGNITLGFMFPFFGPLDDSPVCGGDIPNPDNIQLLEAALYAIKNAQRRFTNFTIGLEAYDSCYSSTAAVDRAVTFLWDRQVDNTCGEKFKPGFVGSLEGAHGSVVAPILSNARVGTTSYSATLPEVTDITKMISSHDEEAWVITRFLKQVRWNYVNLVITGDQEGPLVTHFLNAASAAGSDLCISRQFPLNETSTQIDMIGVHLSLLQSREESNVATVVVIGDDDEVMHRFLHYAPTQASSLQFVVGYGRFLEDIRNDIPRSIAIVSAVPGALSVPGGDSGFDDYFRSLDLSTYDHEADPWFQDYWQYKYNCSADCNSTEQHVESYRRHLLVTPVIDAIDAHIEALAAAYFATGSEGQESYVVALNEVMFNSRIGENRKVAFQPNGDPEGNRFTIWLRQQNGTVSRISDWIYGNLGPLSDGFTAEPSECASPCADPQCPPSQDIVEKNAYVGGDIVLAGFFPVNEWNEELSQCGNFSENGALYVEAMLYAIDQINGDNTILPNIRLGFDGYNTCDSPQRATDIAIDLLNVGSFDLSHSATRRSPDGRRLEHFFGVVGPKNLEVVEGVNKIVSTKMVPMVAYAADDPTISSFSYPYLARTLPSSVVHIHPTLKYLSEQGITLFQLAYTQDLPGLRTAQSYLGAGSWTGVCRTQEVAIPTTNDTAAWDDFFQALQKTPDAKAIYLLATEEDVRRVLQNMEGREERYLIITGPSWYPTEEDFRQFPSAKGAIIIGSQKREYDSFKEYLSQVNTTDPRYTDANPWIADYLQSKGVKNLRDAHTVEDEAIPRIIDAIYALAITIQTSQQINCPGERVCPALLEADGASFLTYLRDQTNFLSPNDQRRINFDYSYSLDYSFDVLNFQDGGIVQIGTMERFRVKPPSDGASLKFYDADGTEVTNSEQQVIACTTTSCLKSCERPDTDVVAESQYDGTGDVWIGGFFELSLPSVDQFQCSDEMILENMQLVEAFLFAIDEINRNFDVLPDIKLSGIGFDSCGSPNRVLKEAGNLVVGTVDYRSAYARQELFVFGIIGGSNSDTTRALSDTVASIGVNQISYAATASEFSDTTRYPHLLRTVPSDVNQARAFIDVLTNFGWSYVSIVYSDTLYGNDMLRIFTDNLDRGTICVAMALRVERGSNEGNFDTIIETLQNNVASRTVVLFTSDIDTRSVLQGAERQGVTDIQWVGSDTWGGKQYVIANATNTAQGAITIRFENRVVQSFVDYFSTINPYSNFRNPWYRQFFMDYNKCNIFGLPEVYDLYCTFPPRVDPERITNPLIPRVINAVYAYAHGLHAALGELCPDVANHHLCPALENQPSRFHEILQDITFPSAEDPGTNFTFDGSGDGVGKYDILNVVPDADTLTYAKVGSWDQGDLSLSREPTFYRNGELIGNVAVETMCSGRCSECSVKDEFVYASLDGPVQIAGVAGVHGSRRCGDLTDSGVLDAEAFLYAIEYVNGQDDILPGVQLGGKVFDGCGVRSVRELSSYLDGVGDFANRSNTWEWIVGVVGSDTPYTTMLVQQTVEHYQLPQVSYSFTPSEDYESVIKTTQDIDAYIQAIQDTLRQLGWTSVTAIADGNDETQMLLYDTFLQSVSDICVERSQTFPDINAAIDASDRVVVVFASARVINTLTVENNNGHKTFIFAGVSDADAVTPSLVNRGSVILSFSSSSPAYEEYLKELSLLSTRTPVNPWLAEYVGRKLECNIGVVTKYNRLCTEADSLSFDKSEIVNAKRIIDGVLTLATSLGQLRESKCGSGSPGLCQALLEAGVDGVATVAMDVDFINNDGLSVDFRSGRQDLAVSLWNIPSDSGSLLKLADWNGTLETFVNEPTFYDETNARGKVESLCREETTNAPTTEPRTTVRAAPEGTNAPTTKPPRSTVMGDEATNAPPTQPSRTTVKAAPETPKISPKPTQDTGNQGAQRGDPIPEDYHQAVWFIIALILSGLGVLLTILAAVIYLLNRNSNYAHLHASFLIYTLAVSLSVMFAGSVVFGLRVNGYFCVLRRILPGVSFSLAFSCVFLMASRYFRILKKERRVSGLGAKYIDNKSQVLALLSLSLVSATVLLQWILYETPVVSETPSNATVTADGTKTGPVLHCAHVDGQFPISFIFIFLLMIGSLVLSGSAMRRSMVYFRRELQSMVVCIVLSLVLAVAWVLCSIIRGSDADFYIPVTCFVGIIQGYILLITLFPPIIRGLYTLDQDLFYDAETNSVIDGNSGFTNPVSHYESHDNVPYEKPVEKATPAEMQLESPM